VRDFQCVIGREAREQSLEQIGHLPEALVACVGGGSNAIGLFHPFLRDAGVAMYGVEAGGDGLETGRHAAPLSAGSKPGVLHRPEACMFATEIATRSAQIPTG